MTNDTYLHQAVTVDTFLYSRLSSWTGKLYFNFCDFCGIRSLVRHGYYHRWISDIEVLDKALTEFIKRHSRILTVEESIALYNASLPESQRRQDLEDSAFEERMYDYLTENEEALEIFEHMELGWLKLVDLDDVLVSPLQ